MYVGQEAFILYGNKSGVNFVTVEVANLNIEGDKK
jgi:hypothetical protein